MPSARREGGNRDGVAALAKIKMRGVLRKLTSCPDCTLAAFGVAFAGSIVVLFLGDLQVRYHDAIARAHQPAPNHAELLAAAAARAVDRGHRHLRRPELPP